MNTPYSDKLKNPKWQRKRLAILNRDNFSCQSCGNMGKELHVHHLKYLPNVKPWEVPDHYLVTYCDTCHETEHMIGEEIQESFAELVNAEKIYIRPMSQLCVLIENHPPFYMNLKNFLNESMIQYLQSKSKPDPNPYG